MAARRVDRRGARTAARRAPCGIAAARRPANGSPATRFSMSGGWTPSVHLYSQSRGKVAFDEAREIFVPGAVRPARALGRGVQRDLRPRRRAGRRRAAGRRGGGGRLCRGRGAADTAGRGRAAGRAAGSSAHCTHGAAAVTPRLSSISRTTSAPRTSASRCAKGIRSIEHVKRYTTTGMATDQGKCRT